MFHRRTLPDLVLLRALPGHAGVAASALRAIGSAVAAHARVAEIRAIIVSGLQVAVVVVVAACGCDARAVHAGIAITNAPAAANHPGSTTVATVVIAVGRRHAGAVHPRVGILDSVVSANQTMVFVVAAIGHLLTGIFVLVPAAVRPEIPIRVIGAVGAIVRVFARLVVTVGVKGAVVAIPSLIL